jgi:hypothetical protein
MFDAVLPWRQELMKKRSENRGAIQTMAIPHQGRHIDILNEVMKSSGIFDGVRLCSQQNMRLMHLCLMYSYPGQEWFEDCYEDVGLRTTKTAYMHFDHDYDIIKSLVYLVDVDEDNGPFSIVPGSEKLISSPCQATFFKFLDQHVNRYLFEQGRKKGEYYRPGFKDPEMRREFLSLPAELQGTSHFGDDVLNDTPLSQALLQKELTITSDVGNCFAFRGGQTIHRGGLARRGERWVLQLMFRTDEEQSRAQAQG